MASEVLFSNFSTGELSPLMYARADYDGYYKGARSLKNVLVLPQGGATRRFGTRLISKDLPSGNVKVKLLVDEEDYYLFIFSDKLITVYKNDVLEGTLVSSYGEDIVKELSMEQKDSTLVITHQSFKPNELNQTDAVAVGWELIAKDFRNEPTYDFAQNYDDTVFTPTGTSGTKVSPVTLNANDNVFNVNHVDGLFFGNQGTLRITEFVTDVQVKGYTIDDFKNTDNIEGEDAYLAETVFNSDRGYAGKVTFYQGRMVLANTADLPGFIGLSATNDYYNFNDSTADDSDTIVQIITGEGSSAIRYLKHSQDLIIFTQSGEFTTPPFSDKPSSPSTTYYIQQTKNGISNVEPVLLDNKIVFIDRGGKIIRNFIYDIQRSSYQAINISLLSTHLITNPVSMGTFENPAANDGIYLLCINEDGTMPIYQSIETENIKSWMSADTDGSFKIVESLDDQVYFVVERTINEDSNATTELYLEKVDFDVFSDSTRSFTFGSPQTVISGLDWLNGKTVWVTADDIYVGQKLIHNNTITLDEAATDVIIGLPVDVEVIPMPVNIQSQSGNNLYLNKRIKNIFVDYYQSLGIKVNGTLIPGLEIGVDSYGEQVPPKDGVYRFNNSGGWQSDEEVVISQTDPFPFTLRGLGLEVESNN